MNDLELRKSRRLTFVPRWSVVPTIRKQQVDQHVYHSAQIVRWLLKQHMWMNDQAKTLEIVLKMLDHDNEEALTGDAPTPSKPMVAPFNAHQDYIVMKCADILEAICFLQEEKAMGNVLYTQSVIEERCAAFHGWWQYFIWAPNGKHTRKPLSNDLIRSLTGLFVNPIHPAMEK